MSDATTPRLKVSREGVVLIKSFEGFRPRAVRDGDGRWVIGYGHRASAREGLSVSEADAELLLQYDLLPVAKALNQQVTAPLNQHQFDAQASFAISVGVERFLASDVLQRLNDGHAVEAADALIGWPEATADARLRRRFAERALFVADPATPMHLAGLLVSPLPSLDEQPADARKETPADARAAAVATLLGEGPPETVEPASLPVEETPGPGPAEPEPAQFEAPAPATIHLQRYSPYAATIVGPLPGFPTVAADSEDAVEPDAGVAGAPSREETSGAGASPDLPEPAPADPATALNGPAPDISPFPSADPLALTPATEADFAEADRPVWNPGQGAGPAAHDDGTTLFEEEPTAPVLRHEAAPTAPRRFDWSVTGAWMIMGLTGLAACAAAAAAFRKALVDDAQLNDYTVIGAVLAVIGVICVSVSSWNLYVQWGRRD